MHHIPTGLGVIHVWGPRDAEENGLSSWSLRPLQTQGDAAAQPRLATALYFAIRSTGARAAYAPNVAAMSGVVVDTMCLQGRIQLNGIPLWRDQRVPADGIFLEPYESLVMSTAGCALIVACAGRNLLVAHAGRDSLIDTGAVMGYPSRKHGSIVNAIIEAFGGRGHSPGEINMCMTLCIPAKVFEHPFEHPVHGAYNRALCAYLDDRYPDFGEKTEKTLFLDLEKIFLAQADETGVRTAWLAHSIENYPDLAHTRDGRDSSRRNLVVFSRV